MKQIFEHKKFRMKQIFEHPGTIRVPAENGNDMLWREDLGIGYLKSNGFDYDDSYWEKYQGYALSENADALNKARIDFVKRYYQMTPDNMMMLCDIGIGNGQFVKTTDCYGYDVNPKAVEWLKEIDRFGDPYVRPFMAYTLWDVLEHIDDHTTLLYGQGAYGDSPPYVFTSMPIHQDLDSLMNSKHLRPNEHIWHFTQEGIIHFMDHYGYNVVEVNDSETKAGREAILSFLFKKRNK